MFQKNDIVRVTRQTSHWYNLTGTVVNVDKATTSRYPVSVRFKTPNYCDVNLSNFKLDELTKEEPGKVKE